MGQRKRAALTVFLAVVWLAVVFGAVWLAVTRRDEYGAMAYLAPVIALFMLVIFVLSFLPRSVQGRSFPELLGKLSTGALILCAIAVLVLAIVKGNIGILGRAVLVLFAVVFVRIFVDYIRDFNKPKKKRSARKRKKQAPTENEEGEQE